MLKLAKVVKGREYIVKLSTLTEFLRMKRYQGFETKASYR